MEWEEAKRIISKEITTRTDINTEESTNREVLGANGYCDKYDYDEMGFIVRIGAKNELEIPWSMLERCFHALGTAEGYTGSFFKREYPAQASDHYCHVHVIGMIFVKAGIATYDGTAYRMSGP